MTQAPPPAHDHKPRPALGRDYWRLWWADAVSGTGDGLRVLHHHVERRYCQPSQQIVPPALLGRVNSVYRMLGWGLIPVGALAGGFIAHAAGLRAPYIVAGVICGLTVLAAIPLLLAAGSRGNRPGR
ncbi:MAG: hypothetical protein M3Z75_27655 [Actinomycetota bacterium]|nr:hypothetical protein [Actinomycetota bacterium]